MTGLNCVLVPLDGSKHAEAALSWAHTLPSETIRLLQICSPEDPDGTAARQYLGDVAASLQIPGCTIEIRILFGEPAEAIVGDAIDVDLIVMCTHGTGGGGRLLFGSVADLVARHAPAPTLLLRGGSHPISIESVRRLVVPLDGSRAAERALVLTKLLAGMLAVSVHLIRVEESPSPSAKPNVENHPGSAITTPEGTTHDVANTYLAHVAESLRIDNVETSFEVRFGSAAYEVMATLDHGDLLLLTTHGQGAARRWQIGNVAEKLLRQASAPVVLVRADTS